MDRVYFDEVSYVNYYNCVSALDYLHNKEVYKIFKECHKKEGKKVKKEIDYEKIKYWDVKVVKVRGICYHPEVIFVKKGTYKCKRCGIYLDTSNAKLWGWSEKPNPSKGNFVNGEDIDKIKFPCWCSFTPAKDVRVIGILNRGHIGGGYRYVLIDVSQQYIDGNVESYLYQDLSKLVKDFDIHVLKGKVILFEKEEGE
jgi:hypothetical protein